MRQRLQNDERDVALMKSAIDKIVEEIQAWEGGAQEATNATLPPGIDLHRMPVPGSVGTIGAPEIDFHGLPAPGSVGTINAGAAPT